MSSPAAQRLLSAQRERLPAILQAIEAAGPAKYYKDSHWAWYGEAAERPHQSVSGD